MAKAKAAKPETAKPSAADLSAQIAGLLSPKSAPAPTNKEKKIADRSGWKGTLQFGAVQFAIGTYKATEQDRVSFNQTHTICGSKLNQGSMKCKSCEKDVNKDEIQKGYEYDDGKFVYISDEELQACEPASDKLMEIVSFVKATEIDPIYFDKTEFVGPAGENKNSVAIAAAAYAMLRQAMVNKGMVAIAKRTQRGREQYVALRPYSANMIVASDLFFGIEVRNFEKTEKLAPAAPEAVALAEHLIENMTKTFDENAQSDVYTARVRVLLDTKIYGGEAPVFTTKPATAESDDLLTALKKSLSQAA